MSKLAVLFPGQGSQYVGMGRELFQTAEGAKVWETGRVILGEPFLDKIDKGPEEELGRTENTQPAIMLASIAAYEVLQRELTKMDLAPDYFAGHSLGEYSAYVAAGSLSLQEGLELVCKRGKLMSEAVPPGVGGMAAVLGMEKSALEEVCQKAGEYGAVEVANYNCPGQIVISGERPGVEKAIELAKIGGAKRAMWLAVSGPFHSSLMRPAGKALEQELQEVCFKTPGHPVFANVDGLEVKNRERIIPALVEQMSTSVQWEKQINNLVDQGVDFFIECGPGKVLTGLVRKIAPTTKITHVEDLTSLEKSLAYLKESR